MREVEKNEVHKACLCLGSNIQPEINLRNAIQLLKERTRVTSISTAWETHAVGAAEDPNFLNACVSLSTDLAQAELIEKIIRPIEAALGRMRSEDKNSPREIDLDLVLYDGQPLRLEYWGQAFMLIPLAELVPQFIHPSSGESLAKVAEGVRKRIWSLARPEVLMDL